MSEKMQMSSFRGLLIETRDGDWGKAEPSEGLAPYRVIRGGDFESVRLGDVSRVPLCYLDPKSASRRTLRDQDILIETAGGTKEKPTGRSLLVTKRILDRFDHPATCASFARFLRVDPAKAVPGYVYWFLQGLYQAGEMWQHQVQHEVFQFVSPQQELEDHQGEGEYEPPGFHPKFYLTLLIRWLQHTSPPPGAVKDPRYPTPESS